MHRILVRLTKSCSPMRVSIPSISLLSVLPSISFPTPVLCPKPRRKDDSICGGILRATRSQVHRHRPAARRRVLRLQSAAPLPHHSRPRQTQESGQDQTHRSHWISPRHPQRFGNVVDAVSPYSIIISIIIVSVIKIPRCCCLLLGQLTITYI